MDSYNIGEINRLYIGHWNSNNINSKYFIQKIYERSKILYIRPQRNKDNINKIDLEIYNYNIVTKNRNRNGGGVAIFQMNSLKKLKN